MNLKRTFFLTDTPGGGTPPAAPVITLPSQAEAGLQSLVQKHQNDALSALRVVYDENYQLRHTNNQLKDQLKGATIPEGAVVLSKEEAEAWKKYAELGKPDDLVKLKTDFETLNTQLSKAEKATLLDRAAKSSGYNADVLRQLAESLDVVSKKVNVIENGQTKEVESFYVKTGETTEVPLKDFAEQNWAAFKPSLEASADTRPAGTRMIGSSASERDNPQGGGTAKGAVKQFLQRRYAQEEEK